MGQFESLAPAPLSGILLSNIRHRIGKVGKVTIVIF